eukprot:CAMPEP_0178915136 /NCGR_PEP_ID=MMETSP0786-20121207/11846_1 /TAXON_ID=186022 /ORGANISM="Thalassionema frauenfeldii, Strain CCMP 1798" /LENGTH=278 /DNA_ID=CAMNT_0020588187 /DNA_START=263 /DNA_END=1099 /DNA_ORIENTATION=-
MDLAFLGYFALMIGGLIFACVAVRVMDLCAAPAERRRMLSLAAALEATARLRQQVIDMMFPEKKHKAERDIETDDGEETKNDDTCAICLEPFQMDDSVVKGQGCDHEFHRACMASWLEKRSDCPTCREPMWTDEAFQTAKLKLLKKDPKAVKQELSAREPTELWLQAQASNNRITSNGNTEQAEEGNENNESNRDTDADPVAGVTEDNDSDESENQEVEQTANDTDGAAERVESGRNESRKNRSTRKKSGNNTRQSTSNVRQSEPSVPSADSNEWYNC